MLKLSIQCTVNGQNRTFRAPPMARLLDVLREEGRLTGAKEGCGEGECGACSVIIDGKLVNSCLVPALQAQGSSILTIEGAAPGPSLSRVQECFLEKGGAQCGICTPGMVMASLALLTRNPDPTDSEIQEALAGNLCRCTGYMKIFDAVRAAGELMSRDRGAGGSS